jgi:hypothetical protein
MTSELREGRPGGGAERRGPSLPGLRRGKRGRGWGVQGTVSRGFTTDYPDGHGFAARLNPCYPRHPWSEGRDERDKKDKREPGWAGPGFCLRPFAANCSKLQ